MSIARLGLLAWSATVLLAPQVLRAEVPAKQSPAELAAVIDRMIEAKFGPAKVVPAPIADDADFLRRASLDLRGRVARVSEVRAFVADPSPDKRQRLVEEMVASSPHVVHFGAFWRNALIPANNNQVFQFQNPQFASWIEQRVRDNVPYDKMVHEILAGPAGFAQPLGFRTGMQPAAANIGSQTFYFANENKPENVASSVSRIFLGVRLECAQCHDHPFASWKRKQFWETAAFFTQIQLRQPRVENGKVVQPDPIKPREIKIPNTDQTVVARFMDGKEPAWDGNPDPRRVLADWVVSKDNPYFARTAVNRLWAHFFGLGLAEPIDDEPNEENPISHPELLDELTRQFVASGYDVRHMIRAMTSTRAYQRSSVQTDPSQSDLRLWARMPVRGMTGEQIYDSLVLAVGYKAPTPQQQQVQFGFGGPRFDFVNWFASQDRKTEKQTSILQALAMMNGKFVSDATTLSTSTTLAAVADASFMSPAQKIETLYLAALGRLPRPEEASRALTYVERGGVRNDPNSALADVFWVLLNSSEFILNR